MKPVQQKSNSSLIEGKDVLLSEEITIFLFDTSSSMYDRIEDDGSFPILASDMCSKFGALKRAALSFVEQRIDAIRNGAKDHVGIITFGEDVKLMHDPMSPNLERLVSSIANMSCTGCTPMAAAVNLAIQTAERFTSGMIRVVICSDGQPDYKDPVRRLVREGFNDYGIVFDTIGVGDKKTRYGLDEEFLKEIAELGGGEYTLISSFQDFSKKLLLIEGERQLLLGSGILMLPGK